MAELTPALTRTNAVAMVAGTIIGASIFVQPSEIARHLGTPLDILLVWLACGVLTLFGALVCAELASAFPRTGGLYVFLRETFSPLAGFLWGWAMFWSMHTGIIAAIATVFARYAAHFVDVGDTGVRLIAVGVILALSALNYVGVRAGSRVQTALTSRQDPRHRSSSSWPASCLRRSDPRFSDATVENPSDPDPDGRTASFLLAMVAGLFAYGGWHMVTYTGRRDRDAGAHDSGRPHHRRRHRHGCYMAMNVLYLVVLPLETVRSSTRIAADAADGSSAEGAHR